MKISIKDYAEHKKISTQAVYQAIAKKKIETVIENGIKYIIVSEKIDIEQEHEKKVKTDSVEFLNEKIKYLEDMLKREKEALERAEADKKELYKQVEQSNVLQLKALETVKQLEHKTEVIEEELIQEKSKKWWQKLLKK